jgi:hypothetical protein
MALFDFLRERRDCLHWVMKTLPTPKGSLKSEFKTGKKAETGFFA